MRAGICEQVIRHSDEMRSARVQAGSSFADFLCSTTATLFKLRLFFLLLHFHARLCSGSGGDARAGVESLLYLLCAHSHVPFREGSE